MSGIDFRLPGFQSAVASPELYVTSVLRNFREASQALGVAVEALVLRLATAEDGSNPDYQIGTLDGEDAAAFSGETHDFKHDDITIHLEEDQLQDAQYPAEQVKDWLNIINGEGTGGGPINPILADNWTTGDPSNPRG